MKISRPLAVLSLALGLATLSCAEETKKPSTGSGGSGGASSSTGGSGGSSIGSGGSGGTGSSGTGSGGTGSGGTGSGGTGSGGTGSGGTGSGGTGSGGTGSGGAGGGDAGGGDRPRNNNDGPMNNNSDGSMNRADGARDTGGGAASWAGCMKDMYAGVAAMEFCTKYGDICGFGTGYTDLADCMTKYGAAAAGAKSCRAGHLCNATMGQKSTHCMHSTGMTPCM